MHFIKTLFLAPLVGLGVFVRLSPYVLLIVAGTLVLRGATLSEDADGLLVTIINLIPHRGDAIKYGDAAGFLGYLIVGYVAALLMHRFNREGAKRAGLVEKETFGAYLVPPMPGRLFLMGAVLAFWGYLIVTSRFGIETGFMQEPYGKAGRFSKDQLFAGPVLAAIPCFLYFPFFGLSGIWRAAGRSGVDFFGSGFFRLTIFGILFILPAHIASLAVSNLFAHLAFAQGWPDVTVGLAWLLNLLILWSMMTAASAMVLRHRLERAGVAAIEAAVKREERAAVERVGRSEEYRDLLRARMER